jgi:hypothetical protein
VGCETCQALSVALGLRTVKDSPRALLYRWPLYAAVLAVVALLIRNLISYASIADDAYISFRYLDNWLGGLGLVFNAGERVEGYTNFLWILLLAPLRLLGMPPEMASILGSLAALVLLLWAVFRTASTLAGNSRAGWLAVILAAGSAHLACWTVSGMETTCFAAFLALANQRLAKRSEHSPGSSMAFGFAVLTRPTGVLHAGLAFFCAGVAIVRRQDLNPLRNLLLALGLFSMFPLAHLIFRLAYYGDLLPNTAYAKLTGEMATLLPGGLRYLLSFFGSGAVVLVFAALLVFLDRRLRNWVVATLACQVSFQMAYTVYVGGDYFPLHRFLVPIVPALSVLAGLGIDSVGGRWSPAAGRFAPLLALALAVLQTGLASRSEQQQNFEHTRAARAEREAIAEWLVSNASPDSTLAINAAGVIPYRTGFTTIDMLGLNDRHIARVPVSQGADGETFVGHRKHDGSYVCSRKPDLVLTSGATFHFGREEKEASAQAALNTFPGDREFLRAPECRHRYQPTVVEMEDGKYLVVYRRTQGQVQDAADALPVTAEGWFALGSQRMQKSLLREAIAAFEVSLQLAPENPSSLANLGFCWMDLGHPAKALEYFEAALARAPSYYDALFGLAMAREKLGDEAQARNLWLRYVREAPDSPWKEVARRHLGESAPSPR